jgi:hypothetical protein
VMFDYSPQSMTRVERSIKQYVPFYSWLRKNLQFQVESLIKRPGRASAQPKIRKGFERLYENERERLAAEDQYVDYEDLPAFQQRAGAVRMLPWLLGGEQRNGSVFLWNPGWTANDLDSLNGIELLGQLTPLVKTPIEWVRGKRLAPDGQYEASLKGWVPVSPTLARAAQMLGVEPRAAASKDAPNQIRWELPAQVPWLVGLLVPDLLQFEKLAPDALEPKSWMTNVPLTARQAELRGAAWRKILPGLAGDVARTRPSKTQTYNRLDQAYQQTLPGKGYIWAEIERTDSEELKEVKRIWEQQQQQKKHSGGGGVPPTSTE